MIKPLPCPFCGADEGLTMTDGSTYRWGYAYCSNCGASAGEVRRAYPDDGKWHEEAIREWNTRAAPQEPDMRHPKIQRLIGANARWSIEMGIVEDLLNDPEYEPSSMEMEYWGPVHDKIAALVERREWRGLTNREISEILCDDRWQGRPEYMLLQTQAKLKEKNNAP